MKAFFLYLTLAILSGLLCLKSNWLNSQLASQKEVNEIDVIVFHKSFYPDKSFKNSNAKIAMELRPINEYLTNYSSAFQASQIAENFLDKIAEKNKTQLIINGNHEGAILARNLHQILLNKYQHLCDSLEIGEDIKREKFRKSMPTRSVLEKRKIWNLVSKHRSAVKKAYRT